ncbi:hypothetical protein HYU50_05585 [Candidatus Woesearchaeota archaeon]|nr:hypothetical protein [Candidatus Woesearchaeota archaeon]
MNNLENILEINIAVLGQKNNMRNTLPGIVEALFKKNDNFPDISPEAEGKKENAKDFPQQLDISPFKKEEKQPYSHFEMFTEYISAVKDRLYGYYSRIKGAFSDIAGKIGYTDKLLKEVEDWGVIYFKTAFKKLARLTPMGIMQRYLEELWICMPKKMK